MLPLRDRFVLEAGDVGQIAVQGSLVDHEYTFERDGAKIAEVSKRWVRVRDTYGVSIEPGADVQEAVIEAIAGRIGAPMIGRVRHAQESFSEAFTLQS